MADITTPPGLTTTVSQSTTYNNVTISAGSTLSVTGSETVLTILGTTSSTNASGMIVVSDGGYLKLDGTVSSLVALSGDSATVEFDDSNSGVTLGTIPPLVGISSIARPHYVYATNSTVIVDTTSTNISGFSPGDSIRFSSPATSFVFIPSNIPLTFPPGSSILATGAGGSMPVAGSLVASEQDGTTATIALSVLYAGTNNYIYNANTFQISGGAIVYIPYIPPTISGIVSSQTTPDNQSIEPFSTVTITSAEDSTTQSITITQSSLLGVLFDPNSATDGSTYDSVTGKYSVSGSAAGITAAIESLTFSPAQFTFQSGQTLNDYLQLSVNDGSTTTNAGPVGIVISQPIINTSSPTSIAVAENAPAVALGITAPTDLSYDASLLTITVGILPTNGHITLADGVTAVLAGQIISISQLTSLLFKASLAVSSANSAFTYTVSDPGGNTVNSSVSLLIGPQVTPSALTLAAASDSGTVGDNITSVSTPIITGTAAGGSVVRLYDGTTLVGSATASTAGTWAISTSTPLTSGNNSLTATAVDATGNVSAASMPLVVTFTPLVPITYAIASTNASIADRLTGTTPYIFTVTRTGDASQAATLNYAVTGSGTNPAPANSFANPTGSVTFAAGDSSAQLIVNVAGMSVSSDETFATTISDSAGLTITTPTASGTILSNNFQILDTTTNAPISAGGQAYTGPVAGLQYQYITLSQDNLNVTASRPNTFIHTGSGFDAIDVSQAGGTNVLDGGTNSNFLVGGTGSFSQDTFFVDDRGASSDIWSTISNFHSGDAATIFGVTPNDFAINWFDGQGVAGYSGLTLHATAAGSPTASITLAGYSSADLNNGALTTSFGTVDGSNYLYVHAN